ncbi:GNAT family N-acetyltransferase [Halobacillus aidingensis]|uniref:Acetyltransferase (GNAT) domain-containing protein n=1 Tax=Halobacillus aidingensis TaxID=240303 RepID=A0A1H0KP16_HALAD|nr:GNAT family N-acetyltransferase [Halobacillus aidingensis]SDO57688.1 Acetyltransferase (GNAT) domain-containing protein [Halobacillus aidingensis]
MTVRHYQPGDENQIQELFKKTFRQDRSLQSWSWKFIDNPKQTEPFILLYDEGGKILGHISLWITEAYIDGKKSKIGLRADTMVDPEARGKGIYKKLNDSLLVEAEHAGIDYLYGFPAPKAKELFLRYTGAHHMTDMPRWMFIQQPFSLLSTKVSPIGIFKPFDKIYKKFRGPKRIDNDYTFKKINKCDHSFDRLADQVRDHSHVMVVRDSAYLNWRYHDHPENTYDMYGLYEGEELKGYVVTTKEEGKFTNGFIVDWLALHDDVWPLLLHQAFLNLHDADIIQTWCLEHSPPVKALKKQGFVHKDSPMPLVGKEISAHTVGLENPEKWFITPGDVDSF